MSIGAGALGAVGSVAQGRYQRGVYDTKAGWAEADALAELQMGQVRAGKVRKAGALAQSEATAGYAGAGIDATTGTPVAVGEKIGSNVEEDAITQLLTGQYRARRLKSEADMDRDAAKMATLNGALGAASSLLGGAAQAQNINSGKYVGNFDYAG